MVKIEELFEEFPKSAVSWRAQSVSRDGKSAMALAYIDARDVMNRLDRVCGVSNWQNRYSHAGDKTVCEIGIYIDNQWIWKSDGAGNTDIEAEKGSLSEAFKRAAVRWGIGRYLYDIPAPWVPCESWSDNGRWKFSKFTKDPWKYIEPPKKSPFGNAATRKAFVDSVIGMFEDARTLEELEETKLMNAETFHEMRDGTEHDVLAVDELVKRYTIARNRFKIEETVADSFGQEFAEINRKEK